MPEPVDDDLTTAGAEVPVVPLAGEEVEVPERRATVPERAMQPR